MRGYGILQLITYYALNLFCVAAPFTPHSSDLFRKGTLIRIDNGSTSRETGLGQNGRIFPPLISDWNDFCDDIDNVMSGLVSPAPESFSALHTLVSKVNEERKCNDGGDRLEGNYINDFKALLNFLLKPNYSIELYLDLDIIKWRLASTPINNNESSNTVIQYDECIQERGEAELYHNHNTLTLSRMALDIATKTSNDDSSHYLSEINDIACQAEKRLALTLGLDLRGTTSSDACFNFALAGITNSSQGLFQTLCCIGIQELARTGHRASFKTKHILHMVEKFAASDIQGQCALNLYHIAGECLAEKQYKDAQLIEDLKNGYFGLHSSRPLLWLWRFSSRQKKLTEYRSKSSDNTSINWDEIFRDTNRPLVIDIGSGMGTSLLNLSTLTHGQNDATIDKSCGSLQQQMNWSDFNYAGADVNQLFVNFANGVISRDTTYQRMGRVHFFSLTAKDFLVSVQSYPGRIAIAMINFPSPYRLDVSGEGNAQLPTRQSNNFMVTDEVLLLVDQLLTKSNSNKQENNGFFIFQTKSEDVAVYIKHRCLSLTSLDSIVSINPVKDIEHQYRSSKRPKRVDEWLTASPNTKRAEGNMYSSTPVLPKAGRPETEVQCKYDNIFVHRLIFQQNRN